MAITEREIKALLPREKAYKVSTGNSMYIQVRPNGKKYFYWNYHFPLGRSKNRKTLYIGTHGDRPGEFTLKEARKRRDDVDHARRQGIDPASSKPSTGTEESLELEKNALFDDVANEYYRRCEKKLAATTLKDLSNRLNNQIIPPFSGRMIASITRSDCVAFKKNIEARGRVVQAAKNFKVLQQVLSFAIDMEYMEEKLNPARRSEYLTVKHEVRHSPRLKIHEIPEFVGKLTVNKMNRDWVVVNSVKVLLLMFMRVGAVIPARWEEIDLSKRLWTIPKPRVIKSGLTDDHLVPLSDLLVEVFKELRSLNPNSEYVFPSERGKTSHISLESPNALIKAMGYGGRFVAHGCRAMAMSIGQDELKFPYHVIDMQLGHKPPGKVRKAYDHAEFMDERIDFMNQWSGLLARLGLAA